MVATNDPATSVPNAQPSTSAAAMHKNSSNKQPWWYHLLVPSDSGTIATLGAYATPDQLPEELVESMQSATAAAAEKDSSLTEQNDPWWYQLLVPSYAGTVTSLGSYGETEQLPPKSIEYINACEALRRKLDQSGDSSMPWWYQLLVPSYAGTVTSLGSYAEREQLPPKVIEYIDACEALKHELDQSGDDYVPLWYQLLVPHYTGTVTSLGSYAEKEQLAPKVIEYINACEALRLELEQSGDGSLPLWYRLLVPSYTGTVATLGSYATPEQLSEEIINMISAKKGKPIHDLTLGDFDEFFDGALHAPNPFFQISIACKEQQLQQQRHQVEEGTEIEEVPEVEEGMEVEEHTEVEEDTDEYLEAL